MGDEPVEQEQISNKGKSKSCPECKKMLLLVVDLLGEGVDLKMKCAYCKKRLLVQIGQKTFIKVSAILAFSSLIFISMYHTFLLEKLNLNIAYIFKNYELPLTE